MENAAKALEIAAGVLLALMIMALVTMFFNEMGIWPQEQDKLESAEQIAKFNKEFEVYQKSTMYGVDVISCLNKAVSNNEKYGEGNKFFTGIRYEETTLLPSGGKKNNYFIDVYVHVESPLKENLRIYYMSNTDNQIKEVFNTDGTAPGRDTTISKTMSDAGFEKKTTYTTFTDFSSIKLNPNSGTLNGDGKMVENGGGHTLEKSSIPSDPSHEYYSLRTGNDELYALLALLGSNGDMKIIKSNTNSKELHNWSKAIWETALYDFKTRKFKCDYIDYSPVTGRVNEIYFSEI